MTMNQAAIWQRQADEAGAMDAQGRIAYMQRIYRNGPRAGVMVISLVAGRGLINDTELNLIVGGDGVEGSWATIKAESKYAAAHVNGGRQPAAPGRSPVTSWWTDGPGADALAACEGGLARSPEQRKGQ
jgi:hypothetical protein